ncbi:Ig-like domain-containing protein, partial [Flavobacterium sp. S87F.05.LMB.W.Kidney.N]|uniref:Ig-like domain-containing protein n=1 Tax=Flavobacterium sp. S87F.05.LMB.W.Kidney.N TaxID=1278758 RepID=UPI001416F71F
MRNFTFNLSRFSRHIFLIVFLLICTYNASAQFYTKHYIAPAPWQYFSKANEIVIATNSTTPVTIEILKSDGTLITNSLTASKGSPAVYRFAGLPKDAPALKLNTVINAAGLIVTGSKPISINLRNIASDALGGEGSDKDIKGNAALTSFGDAGIGIRYRIGYYRDGSLGNFGGYGDQRPIYSIMAITNGTSVKFNSTLITLNAGQSYLFTAPIGTLVESSNPTVMNTSAAIDTPDGCGDGAYNQIPPEAVLGTEYFIQRGKGNDTAEQTTVVATKANTKVTVDTFSATGVLTGTIEKTLLNAGDFFTFGNGISKTNFSASRVFATNTVAVYSGTARDCEVDVYTIAPVSQCGGSNFIETAKFRNYGVGSLPYFGYVLLKDASSKVYVNGQDIETKSGISARRQLGNTGWYLINFEDTQIGSPDVLSLSSDAKLTVSIVQQGGGFTMAGFFSNFAVQPEDPTFNYISGGGCTNNSALLKTQTGLSPYQWYLNGVAIAGANSDTYTATKTGSYSVASTLTCGAQTQSKPVSVTLCTDLGITKTVDNATPCVGSNIEFTVKLSNLGGNNSTGVSVNDLLPTGYTFVSSTQTTGNYNATTGVWSIGDVNGGATETLKIIAKVNASGVYTNAASLPSTTTDSNAANNSASVSTTPNPLPTLTINNPASVCSPSTVDLTSSTVTAGSSSNLTFTYWTNSAATAAYATPTAATAGTYYIKATNSFGCSVIKSVVVTVATPPNSGVLSGVQNICTAGTSNFTSNGNTGGVWTSNNTSIATVNSSTGLVTGVSSGTATITYKVTGTGGCSDAVSIRTITVTTAPNAGTLSGTQNICIGGTSTFSSSGDTGGAWTSDNTSIATVNSSTGVVTGVSSGTATITYKIIGTGGCSDVTSTRTITVNPTPIAPTASVQSFCSADNKTVNDLTVTTGSNLKWYTQLTGGNALASTDILTTRTYYVSQTSASGCESSRTSVDVTINPTPVAPTASAQLFCSADNKTINDLTVTTGSNLKWYTQLTGGSSLASTDILTTRTYYVSQATNTCESARTAVSVIVTTTPSTPILSSITQPTCSTFTGSFTINNYDSTYNYIITPSTGVINNAGTITAPTGSYTISASINGCSSGNVSFVINSILCANADSFGTKTSGLSAVNIGNVKTNDTLNGLAVTAANTSVTPKTDGVLSVDADGEVTLSADAPSGSYSITYEICEKNTANCKTAAATVVVDNKIKAVVDTIIPINGNIGGTTVVLTANDTLNGNPVVIGTNSGEVSINIVGTLPTGLTLNSNGTITVSPSTPKGDYNVEYVICEVGAVPANCDSVTIVVPVTSGDLVANPDTVPSVIGSNANQTLNVNVLDNDTKNGQKLDPSDVNLTV